MAKGFFNYSNVPDTEYAYYGFHLKNGRYHIDTKRITKLRISYAFPKELFEYPRNVHYFVPKYKRINDWGINILLATIDRLSDEWNEEFETIISKIKTPSEVSEDFRVEEMSYTSSADDYDQINEDALLAGISRIKKYEKVIKSIHLQYIQKITAEFFRALLNVVKDRGYFSHNDDFCFGSFVSYVKTEMHANTQADNPLLKLNHYKYLCVLNNINNFLKHNTRKAYNALAEDSYLIDEQMKSFQKSFVYTKEETGISYRSGMYSGDWLKIGPDFINNILVDLCEFSKEFCKLLYKENADEASWNSDQRLINILRNDVIYSEW